MNTFNYIDCPRKLLFAG